MTYRTKAMNDAKDRYGAPWKVETMRVWHSDERQCWSVTEPYDKNYGTAIISWWDEGEFFDGTRWRPIKERNGWLKSRRATEEGR